MSADSSKLGTLKAQRSMFERASAQGFARKNIEADAGFPDSTMSTWARGEAEMPLSAFRRLIASGALPLDMLAMLLPDGVELVPAGAGEVDHAALAGAAAGYVGAFAEASHPASECGCAVGPNESARLAARRAALRVAEG